MNCLKYSGRAGSLLALLPLVLAAQRAQDNVIPLKSWSSPLYWHANQAESQAAAKASQKNTAPKLVFPGAASPDALTFVAITPCRLVDTRGGAGDFNGDAPFGGPSIAPKGIATFPVQSTSEAMDNTTPAPCGAIPSIAEAYSFNLTVIPKAAGAVSYVTLWPAGSTQPVVATINDGQGLIVDDAAIVAAGTGSGGISLYNSGPAAIDVVIDMNGYFAAPSDLNGNTAIGAGTLADSTGGQNTAVGSDVLNSNTIGYANTASGYHAMESNTTGNSNTASGESALASNTTGSADAAYGLFALQNNTTGHDNTASGTNALKNNTTGASNIAVGSGAAVNAPTTNSNSIYIGNGGTGSDPEGSIRLGTGGTQTSFFAAGIRGVTTGSNTAVAVMIDANGQLGTVSSSERFKEDIQDMNDASSGLLRLRPVTYRYKQAYKDGLKPIDYGLIAEEVDQVYPDLVARDKDGQIETVQYQKLTPMLLNELQKQAAAIELYRVQNRKLEERLAALEILLSVSPEPAR